MKITNKCVVLCIFFHSIFILYLVSIATKKKRRLKTEAALHVQQEQAKKFGICKIDTRMADFLAG